MTTILFIQCTCCRIRDQEDKTPPLQFRVQASRGGRGGGLGHSPRAEARLYPFSGVTPGKRLPSLCLRVSIREAEIPAGPLPGTVVLTE